MGVVKDAVANGVGQRRVADVRVPLFGEQLAGDDGGAQAVAIVEDFVQVMALLLLERGQSEVIDDEDVEAGQPPEQTRVGAVGMRQVS